jgi:hypothetical protein
VASEIVTEYDVPNMAEPAKFGNVIEDGGTTIGVPV